MRGWFDELHRLNREWMDLTVARHFDRGIRQSTVEKYADPAHFVYQLLQNAEDQRATSVRFVLRPDRLIFAHNGEPFTQQDVENITGIGNTEKPEQANKIGRFGIGFKSVFVVTERPRIYTTLGGEPFAFAIEDLVVPVRLDDPRGTAKPGKTQFVLPLLPGRRADIYTAIQQRLSMLGADTLLFLDHLRTLHWEMPDQKGLLQCQRDSTGLRCVLTEQYGRDGTLASRPTVAYLLFSRPVEVDDADRSLTARIAFRLENGTLAPEKGQCTASVYFPTREKTGLKFRLHAPFILNDSRANIKEQDAVNVQLIQACAELLVDSLPKLRDQGLLTAEAFHCLPIRKADFDGSPFYPLFAATREAFRTQALLPTAQGSSRSHVRPGQAKISDSRPLRQLLPEPQLTQLFGTTENTPVSWLSEQIQANVHHELRDYLIHQLEVEELDTEKFARKVDAAFLNLQTDKWFIAFYGFLNEASALWRNPRTGFLRYRDIIRVEPAEGRIHHTSPFAAGGTPRVYLPGGAQTGLLTVKRTIVQDPAALRFLTDLGLKRPNITDRVIEFVLARYPADPELVSDEQYASDIHAIADAIQNCREEDQPRLLRELTSTPFIRACSAADAAKKSWRRAAQVYRDTHELRAWFAGNPEAWFVSPQLEAHPRWQALLSYLERQPDCLASHARVSARPRSASEHVVLVDRWGKHERGLFGFDPEAWIDGLEHALRHPNAERARMLWRLLIEHLHLVRGTVERCSHAHYGDSLSEEKLSRIGDACCFSAWLPDLEGRFHEPSRLRLADLPDEFEKRLLAAKQLALQLGMSGLEEEEVAERLRVPPAMLAALVDAYRRDRTAVEKLIEQLTTPRLPAEFPGTAATYLERRGQKVGEESLEAPLKMYEVRQRSVRTSANGLRPDVRAYLRDFYTNQDRQMVCQICEQEMPFKLDDEQYYFEAVQFLRDYDAELKPNVLALCPVCAAKYRYANGTPDASLEEAIGCTEGLTIPLVLTRKPHTIRFHPFHLKDLQEALRARSQLRPVGAG